MNLLTNFKHRLRFYADNDIYSAPDKSINNWKKLKETCEDGQVENIVGEMRDCYKLEQNKNLQYLDRVEGGIGDNSNIENKQLRFRCKRLTMMPTQNDAHILIDQISDANSGAERWTYEELADVIQAFVKVANELVEEDCVHGCIELVPHEK
ncbi:hypothetical protein OAG24_00340 [bacterium]|nr:hypothetical protein [bacterium]